MHAGGLHILGFHWFGMVIRVRWHQKCPGLKGWLVKGEGVSDAPSAVWRPGRGSCVNQKLRQALGCEGLSLGRALVPLREVSTPEMQGASLDFSYKSKRESQSSMTGETRQEYQACGSQRQDPPEIWSQDRDRQ